MRLCSQYYGQDSHLTCKRCGTKGIKTKGHIFNRPNVAPLYFQQLVYIVSEKKNIWIIKIIRQQPHPLHITEIWIPSQSLL